MSIEERTQACDSARIDKIHGETECGIFNSFVVREIELVGKRWLLNVPLQPAPARETVLARKGKLCVAET